MSRTKREASKLDWSNEERPETLYDINCGSLQRIADACEKMCLDREKLERDYASMKRARDGYRNMFYACERSKSSLRGVITKLKKKIKELEELGATNDQQI